MTKKYKPIDCTFHDGLELLAMHQKECVVEYLDRDDVAQRVVAVITDVYARSGEEFLKLETGEEIRLDRLIGVDGKRLGDIC